MRQTVDDFRRSRAEKSKEQRAADTQKAISYMRHAAVDAAKVEGTPEWLFFQQNLAFKKEQMTCLRQEALETMTRFDMINHTDLLAAKLQIARLDGFLEGIEFAANLPQQYKAELQEISR